MTMPRMDVDSAFAARQLRQVRAQVIKKDYPELLWDRYVPMEQGVSPGADSFAHQEMDSVGDAKVISNYADDVPLTDVMLTETAQGIVGLATGYDYSIQDLRKAQLTGMDLRSAKGEAARDRLERKLDEIVATGSSAHAIEGFIDHSSVSEADVADPGGGKAWSAKTALQRLDDILEAVGAIQDATENVEGNVVDVLLPPAQYFLMSAPLASTATSLLQYVQSAIPQVRSINVWNRLKTAGAAATARMIVYTRDPGKVAAIVPIRLNMLADEKRGFRWIQYMEARTGGTVFYKPKSAIYRDAI